MPSRRRMSAADAAWLGLDRPEHRMVVTAVLRLGRPVELSALREVVAGRLIGRYPNLTARPVRSRLPLVPPTWRDDPEFDLARHVVEVGERVGDEASLMTYAGELMGAELDPSHPPWQLTLVRVGEYSAIVARLHHCLADGIALAGVLLSLADEPPVRPSAAKAVGPAHRTRTEGSSPGPGQILGSALRTMAGVLVGRSDRHSPLRGPASVGRRAGWTAPLDLAAVKTAARGYDASVNDVLLAAVAGGLRGWLLERGQEPREVRDLRVMVPVDLRRGAEAPAELGNRFGIVFVELPVAEPSRRGRVGAVKAATGRAKRSAVAPASYALLSLVGVLPHWGQGLAAQLLGRVATVIVTNVPGPRSRLTLAGAPLTDVVFWVPHIGPIGIGVSIFSYAGTVTIGVATNSSLDIDPLALVSAIEAELVLLSAT